MTAADHLKTIRERVEAATEGPWEAVTGTFDSEVGKYEGAHIPGVAEVVSDYYIGEVPPFESADAEFIAHARTDLPRLLDAVEAVMRELEKLEKKNIQNALTLGEIDPGHSAYSDGHLVGFHKGRIEATARIHEAISTALEGK